MVDVTKFNAVIGGLKPVVATLVESHRTAGHTLTWRLLHAIETEALGQLEKSGDLMPGYINMLRASPVFCYPDNDDPVNFGESNAIACAFSMIYGAYNQSALMRLRGASMPNMNET
jgi:hypothetical protein